MKKRDLLRRLRQWDEDAFDLTEKAAGLKPERPEAPADETWRERPVKRLERGEVSAFRHLYPVLACILCAAIICFLLTAVVDLPPFGDPENPANNEVSKRYLEDGITETGAVNAVAGMILDYRAFDTLGESHVLYTAMTAVMILLLGSGEAEPEDERRLLARDAVLHGTARVLTPLLLIFGLYIMFAGHLGPGGGFSGGAVVGGALILCATAFGFERVQRVLTLKRFRTVVLCALSAYSLLKCYSFFCGANGLETIFSAGTPGKVFSSGLILPLNLAVGAVVACTMYGFYSLFKRGRI